MSEPRRWRDPLPLETPPLSITGNRIVDEILARRGFTSAKEAREWLTADLLRHCASAELSGMDLVVARIARAIDAGARIRVFGDYDCDGLTSSAIISGAIECALDGRGSVDVELPSREQGYGLRPDVLDRAIADGVTLLVAVDCGSNDVDLIADAKQRGLDVVVIDHHQLGVEIPDGAAVVNPQRDAPSHLRAMTAAGLAYLVVVCLARDGYQVAPPDNDERIYLDLAAIGTVGDVGSLREPMNRAIVRAGVPVLQQTRRLGLRALARQGRFDIRTMTAEDISFRITPRLNAPGRIGSPEIALKLLTATDMDSAEELAQQVLAADQERKVRSEEVAAKVVQELGQDDLLTPVIVLHGDSWPSGVLGPVAAKVAETHRRPAVILGQSGEHLSGSGRSFGEWNLAEAFAQIEFLLRHGGHSKAAGLTVERHRVEELRKQLSDLYEASGLAIETEAELQIEADIDDDPVTLGLVERLDQLGPFGAGNERPLLRWRGVQINRWAEVGKDKTHAHVWLSRGNGTIRAIFFGGAQRMRELGPMQRVDALVELSVNVWNQTRSVDAKLVDVQPLI